MTVFNKIIARTYAGLVLAAIILAFMVQDEARSQPRENLTYSEFMHVGDLNPYRNLTSRGSSDRVFTLIYEPLFRYDYFSEQYVSVLADNISVSPNGQNVIIHLRQDVRWHDGEVFTAEDVRFTIDFIKQRAANLITRQRLDSIISVRVLGDHELELLLSGYINNSNVEYLLPDWILPAHLFDSDMEAVSREKNTSINPVGTGPYKFMRRTIEGAVHLQVNENYWGKKPVIDQIRMERVSDIGTMVMRLMARITKLAIEVPADQLPMLEGSSRHRIEPYQSYRISTFGFNFKNEKLMDPRLRKAMVLGTNRGKMLNQWFGNRGVLLSNPFVPSSSFYNPELEPQPYDPDSARKLIREAGYTQSDQNRFARNSNNEILNFNLVVPIILEAGETSVQNVVQDFVENMRDIGIQINVLNRTRDDYDNIMYNTGDFDMIWVEWVFDPIYDIIPLFHSSNIGNGGSNVIAYESGYLDQLFDSFLAADDPATKIGIMQNVQEIIREENPYIFLFSIDFNAVFDYRYIGVRIDPFYFFSYVPEWSLLPGID